MTQPLPTGRPENGWRHGWLPASLAGEPFLGEGSPARLELLLRRRSGMVVGLVLLPGTLLPMVAAVTLGPGVLPADPLALAVTAVAVGMALIAMRAGIRYAERTLPWIVAAGIVGALLDPYVTVEPAHIVHAPALLALLLAGPAEVIVLELGTLLLMAVRAGATPSPYLDPRFLFAAGNLAVVMLLLRWSFGMMLERSAALSRRASALLDSFDLPVRVDLKDADRPVYQSQASLRLLREVPPGPLDLVAEVVHPDDRAQLSAAVARVEARPGATATFVARVRTTEGEWIPLEARVANLADNAEIGGVVTIVRDVSAEQAERAELARRLEHMATHDGLTGLPNRVHFRRQLAEVLAELRPGQAPGAVLLVDLDNFKLVNDSLGHDVGDRLVQVISNRLRDSLTSRDSICRFGGDEFLALVGPRPTRVDVLELIDGCLRAIREPVEFDGHRVATTASIGVTFLRTDHDRPEVVIREADAALHAAKSKGRDRVTIYDESMQRALRLRHELGQGLGVALQRGELSMDYQPKYRLEGGELLGFEALLRWRPTGGAPISPVDFIPVAEETGLIIPIGEWVLITACRQLAAWQRARPDLVQLRMAVNLSVHQIRTPGDGARYVSVVRDVLAETGIAPENLEVELTESALMPNSAHILATLHTLRRMGIHLAVDDFGTGYSSLAYLRRFPVDILKIDRAFVSTLVGDAVSTEIVSFVVALARALGGVAVAEGVETQAQLTALRRLGADCAQGYLFSKPLPPSACEGLLDAACAANSEPDTASA